MPGARLTSPVDSRGITAVNLSLCKWQDLHTWDVSERDRLTEDITTVQKHPKNADIREK